MDDAQAAPEALDAAIAHRRHRLRTLGRWAGRAGVVLLAVGILVMAPDPSGRGLFGGDEWRGVYAAVPADLYKHLQAHGAAVREMPPGWGSDGATTFSIYGIYLLVLLAGHIALGWLMPALRRRAIVLLTFPLWFFPAFLTLSILGWAILPVAAALALAAYPFVGRARLATTVRMALVAALPAGMYLVASEASEALNGFSGAKQALTARIGTIADRPGGAAVPPDGTVTSDPMRLEPAEAKTAMPKGWVRPYHLQPEALPQPLRDQAHYLLAQQAYMRDDPANAALHLRGMAGAWRPSDWRSRGRIGAMATWAAIHGASPGNQPVLMAEGAPFTALRHAMGWLLVIAGCAAGSAGLYFCHRSQKLTKASEYEWTAHRKSSTQ